MVSRLSFVDLAYQSLSPANFLFFFVIKYKLLHFSEENKTFWHIIIINLLSAKNVFKAACDWKI